MRKGYWLTAGLAVLALMPLLYVGSYFPLVRKGMSEGNLWESVSSPSYGRHSYARHRALTDFFAPIHEVDRLCLRPKYWHWQFDGDLPPSTAAPE